MKNSLNVPCTFPTIKFKKKVKSDGSNTSNHLPGRRRSYEEGLCVGVGVGAGEHLSSSSSSPAATATATATTSRMLLAGGSAVGQLNGVGNMVAKRRCTKLLSHRHRGGGENCSYYFSVYVEAGSGYLVWMKEGRREKEILFTEVFPFGLRRRKGRGRVSLSPL